MTARITKVFVLVFWAAMAAWLLFRQPAFSVQTAEDLSEMANLAASGGPVWSGIYFVDKATGKKIKIGYSRTEMMKAEKGFVIRSESRMKITAQGQQVQVRVISKILTNLKYELLSLDFSMLSDSVKFEMFGRVQGDKLDLEIRTAAGTQKQTIDLPSETVLPETLLRKAAEKGLEVGQVIKVPFFEPTTFAFSEAELKVVEKTTLPEAKGAVVYHLTASYMGVNVEVWIDKEGRTLREEAAALLTKVETREQALTLGWKNADLPVDLVEIVAVKTEKTLKNPRAIKKLKLRLSGIDPKKFDFNDHRQRLEGDVVTITVEEILSADRVIPITDAPFRKWLSATPTIQTKDPTIQAKSDEIVGSEKNALNAARLISDWVFRSIEKRRWCPSRRRGTFWKSSGGIATSTPPFSRRLQGRREFRRASRSASFTIKTGFTTTRGTRSMSAGGSASTRRSASSRRTPPI